MTARAEGWELRLSAAIEAARTEAFAWGAHDCAGWAATIVEAVTGRPFPAGWLGQYKTARGAQRFLRRQGFGDLGAAITGHLGQPLASPRLARRGDIVLSASGGLGVCTGRDALFLAPDGLTALPIGDCQMAWEI